MFRQVFLVRLSVIRNNKIKIILINNVHVILQFSPNSVIDLMEARSRTYWQSSLFCYFHIKVIQIGI